jgi:GGDEF domain-containing protein
VSIGVVAHDEGEKVGRLMTRAEETMYRTKALGGGRVEHG